MAVIDLRNASVMLMDGSVGSATSTTSADAAKGAKVIPFTSASGFLVGDGFYFGSETQRYSIIGISTNDVTIAPALVYAETSGATVTQVGKTLEIKVGEGTVSYSEKRAVTYVLNRGRIYSVKLGDDAPVEVSFDLIWEFLRSASGEPPTVEEALKQIGGAIDWVTSADDVCEPYAVDILICYSPPCATETESILLQDFRYESLDHDLKAGTISIKGSSNIPGAVVSHNLTS